MSTPLDDISRACLPRAALPLLAPLRCEAGLRVALHQDELWLSWEPGNERVLHAVMPLPGVRMFAFQAGRWHAPGRHLPTLEVPLDLEEQPLDRLLFPAPVQPLAAQAEPQQRVIFTLASDDHPRPTSAILCSVADLAAWADTVSAPRLAGLVGMRRGQDILVLGPQLPLLPTARRFWGQNLLFPLGYRPEPNLPERTLRELLGLEDDELGLAGPERIDAVPRAGFQRLARAGLKWKV